MIDQSAFRVEKYLIPPLRTSSDSENSNIEVISCSNALDLIFSRTLYRQYQPTLHLQSELMQVAPSNTKNVVNLSHSSTDHS